MSYDINKAYQGYKNFLATGKHEDFLKMEGFKAMQLKAFIEKASDVPSNFKTGTLIPEVSRQLVTSIVAQDSFLREIDTITTKKTTYLLRSRSIASRQMIRPTTDTEQTPSENFTDLSNLATLKRGNLIHGIDYDAIDDNMDNPNFGAENERDILISFANNIADLSMNGTADDYAASAWTALNKGFLQVFEDSITAATAGKTVHSYDTDGDADLIVSFDGALKAMPDKYKNRRDLAIFVSPTDRQTYGKLLASADSSSLVTEQEKGRFYDGYRLIEVPYMATGTFFIANPKNLTLLASINDIRRHIIDEPKFNRLTYMYSMNFDFAIKLDDAIVAAKDRT